MTGSHRLLIKLNPSHDGSKNRYGVYDPNGNFVMSYDSSKVVLFAAAYADAWCSKSADAVAACYASDGQISINRAPALRGQAAIADMAAGFYADFPDLVVLCDGVRVAGSHVVFLWTLEGHHAQTKAHVRISGWEEWEFDDQMKIISSLGWFDVQEYERQIRAGA
jgi:nuclear transport factor 2 (NTF2) superfamily protein